MTQPRRWSRAREIRRPAVGRRNYLCTGSVRGGQRLAAVCTPILSCRNLGIDTRQYLINVLGKIRDGWAVRRLIEKGHPAQVVLSGMNAVGVMAGALDEVKGNIPALFG